jgi:hypothetical protein
LMLRRRGTRRRLKSYLDMLLTVLLQATEVANKGTTIGCELRKSQIKEQQSAVRHDCHIYLRSKSRRHGRKINAPPPEKIIRVPITARPMTRMRQEAWYHVCTCGDTVCPVSRKRSMSTYCSSSWWDSACPPVKQYEQIAHCPQLSIIIKTFFFAETTD